MEMIPEIDVTIFMQIIDMAFTAAFYTVAFIGGAVIGIGLVSMLLGDDK